MTVYKQNVWPISLKHPMLIPGYKVIPLAENEVNLRREEHTFAVRGKAVPLLQKLLQLMDGTRDLKQLASLTNTQPQVIQQVLMRLYHANVLVDRDDLLTLDNTRFGLASWLAHHYAFRQNRYTHQVYKDLVDAKVLVIGYSDLTQLVCEQLQLTGIESVQRSSPDHLTDEQMQALAPDFLICAERTIDYRTALRVNELALHFEIPWLAAWLAGSTMNVTHVMVPGENACFECLLLRQRGTYPNFEADLAYELSLRQEVIDLTIQESIPAIDNLLASFTTLRTIAHLAGYQPEAPVPQLLEVSAVGLESTLHPVLRLPQCPACGPVHVRGQANPYSDIVDYLKHKPLEGDEHKSANR